CGGWGRRRRPHHVRRRSAARAPRGLRAVAHAPAERARGGAGLRDPRGRQRRGRRLRPHQRAGRLRGRRHGAASHDAPPGGGGDRRGRERDDRRRNDRPGAGGRGARGWGVIPGACGPQCARPAAPSAQHPRGTPARRLDCPLPVGCRVLAARTAHVHSILRFVVRIAIAAALLGLLFSFVPVRTVADALVHLSVGWLAVGLLLQFALRAVAAVRMKVIADSQGVGLSYAALWRIHLATQFYATLLPGPVAGGGATWVKYVQHGATHGAAAAMIVLNRGIAFVVMIAVGLAAWAVDAWPPHGWIAAAAIGAALAAAPVLLDAKRGARPPAGAAPDSDAAAAPAVRSRVMRMAHGLLRRLLLFHAIPRGGKLVVLISSVVYEAVGAAVLWCFARAVGIELSLVTVLWMRAALQVMEVLLPIAPAGLGLREAGLVGLGALVGVPAAAALAWSLTIFFGTLVVAAAGGLVEARSASNHVLRLAGRWRGVRARA